MTVEHVVQQTHCRPTLIQVLGLGTGVKTVIFFDSIPGRITVSKQQVLPWRLRPSLVSFTVWGLGSGG